MFVGSSSGHGSGSDEYSGSCSQRLARERRLARLAQSGGVLCIQVGAHGTRAAFVSITLCSVGRWYSCNLCALVETSKKVIRFFIVEHDGRPIPIKATKAQLQPSRKGSLFFDAVEI